MKSNQQPSSTPEVNRRNFLMTSAVAGSIIVGGAPALAGSTSPVETTNNLERNEHSTADAFELPKLEYAYDALEPHIDAQTMEIHHSRHHAAYVKGLNTAVANSEYAKQPAEKLVAMWKDLPEAMQKGVRNAGGGHVNHTLFWSTLAKSGGAAPSGELLKAIEKSFGSVDGCWEKLAQAATGVFGSGWGWISWNPQSGLVVESTPNQDSPLSHGNVPLFGIDVWEHAYYLKYQNMRANYITAIRNVVAWDRVADRFNEAQKV